MACIKRKYNYGFACLYPEQRYGKVLLCGNSVDVVSNDTVSIVVFRGFIDVKSIARFNAVNLLA